MPGLGVLRLSSGGGGWEGVDHLAGAGVVEFFTGLVFDGVGIILKAFHVSLQKLIFPGKALQFAVQHLRVMIFLPIGREAILTKDDVISETDGENGRSDCGGSSPTRKGPASET